MVKLKTKKRKKRRYTKKNKWSYSTWKLQGDNSKNFDSFKIYIIKCWDDRETFYKLGKTYTLISKRFEEPESMPYNYEVVYTKESNAYNISRLEKEYHKKLKEYKYVPLKHFHGCQECFSNIKDYDKQ